MIAGDSHAEHIASAMNEALGDRYRFQSIADGNCFLGDKIAFPDIGNRKECDAARQKIRALKGQPIHALIRVQRWHDYVTTREGIEATVNDTLGAFGLNPERLVIVGATVTVPFACEVARYYSRSTKTEKTCSIQPDHRADNKTFLSVTKSLAVPANVRFVYPYLTICPNDACRIIEGNVSYYWDTHHLSKHGALLVAPEIARALESP